MGKLIHGGDIYSAQERISGEIIDFSANINPLGLPDSVKKALVESMEDFSCYPDPLCRKLIKEIAKSENVAEESILCGNGAADIIFRISQAIRPRQALIASPTFAEYEQSLEVGGCHIDYFTLKEENDFLVTEDILDAIHPRTDIVFLCNPNNPTGQLIEPHLLERILVRCASCGALLVVDECFRDFLDDPESNSMNSWVESFPNLLILRAFTKHFAMAGLRLGYCLCSNPPLLERMKQCGQPWSVSVPAQIAGVAALQDTDYLQKSRKVIQQERKYLKDSLSNLQIKVIGSHANYIFFRMPDSKDLAEYLEKDGILIRSCANYRGLDESYYRIAVKSHLHNEKLVAALKKFMEPPTIEPLAVDTMTVTVEHPIEETEPAKEISVSETVSETAEATETIETSVEETSTENPQSACPTEETVEQEVDSVKIPNQDAITPPSAEQKKQYKFLREKSKRYDWEGEEQ